MVEVPKQQDRVVWLANFRSGKVENVYEWVSCPDETCVCEFDNLADCVIHCVVGKHGPFSDRQAEEHRRKFKYFTRQTRYKERKYREQNQEVSDEPGQVVQETLSIEK